MKKKIKLAFVMDDYKLPNKEQVVQHALKKMPYINEYYKFKSEKIIAGPGKGVTSVFRYYELKK